MEMMIEAVSNLGFPIACVLGLGFFVYKVWETNNRQSQERENKLYDQMDKFSTTMKNFNDTLIRIDARLENVEKKIMN